MMWFYLAASSAILLGLYDVAKKHSLNGNAVLPVLFYATLIGSTPFILLLLAANVRGWIGFETWPALPLSLSYELNFVAHLQFFGKGLIVGSAWVFSFFALKHLPVSIVTPIRSSAPVWTLLGALVIFAESLSTLQWLGVCVTFFSYYILTLAGRKEQLDLVRNRWVGYILIATLIGASSGLYDKFLMLRYPPLIVQCWFYFYLVVILGVIFLWHQRRNIRDRFIWRRSIPLIGVLLAASDFVYFRAVAEPGAMISLISVVRRSSVVVAFLVGTTIFHEKNRRIKAISVAGILLGIVLITLSKR